MISDDINKSIDQNDEGDNTDVGGNAINGTNSNAASDGGVDVYAEKCADESGEKNIKVKTRGVRLRIAKVLTSLRNALYPLNVTCDICAEELVANTRYRICASCNEKLPFVKGHRCIACGVPLNDEADYCNRCQASESAFVVNRSPLVYENEARKLIYTFKFGKKKYIAQTLGALMADEFLKSDMTADIITFVPMTGSEERKRGFNQSELLAYEVGQRLNIPVLPALVKTKETSAQKELKGKERAKNLNGAFVCVFGEVRNRNILLIDDIFTTGATANACSEALIKAKARQVSVLTAAVTKLKIPVESADGTVQM